MGLSLTINLSKKNTIIAFFIGISAYLLAPSYFPFNGINYFAPYLILSIYQLPLLNSLWRAFLCGLLLDLFVSDQQFGLLPLNYSLVTWCLYNQKHHFFSDNLSTLPGMVLLFSILSTLLQALLLTLFHQWIPIYFSWVLTDLLIYPLIDALFAFTTFLLPALLLGNRVRRGDEYFANDRKVY